MFFYLLNGLPFGSVFAIQFGDGSATAPSIAWASQPNTGFYKFGPNQFGFSSNGAVSLVLGAAGAIYGANGTSQLLQMPASGAITLTAAGTNQNITLTPSGTGQFIVNTTANTRIILQENGVSISQFQASGNNTFIDSVPTNQNINLRANVGSTPVYVGVFTYNQHLLLGGLTTDGTGVLQFPAATTTAGGIGFGNDVFLSRHSAGVLLTTGSHFITGEVYTTSTGNGLKFSGSSMVALGATGVDFRNNTNAVILSLTHALDANFSGYVKPNLVAVASLPAAAAGNKGARLHVSDANATTFASVVAGGGANIVPVYSDGTNWRIG